MEIIVNVIGWVGSFCVLTAYGLLSIHRLSSRSVIYQTLNVAGSIFLVINTYFFHAYPSTFVNIVWLIIAIFALINIRKTNDNDSRKK